METVLEKVTFAPVQKFVLEVEIPIVGVGPGNSPVILKSSMIQRSLELLFSSVILTRRFEMRGRLVISTVEYPSVVRLPPEEGVNSVTPAVELKGTLAIPVPVE